MKIIILFTALILVISGCSIKQASAAEEAVQETVKIYIAPEVTEAVLKEEPVEESPYIKDDSTLEEIKETLVYADDLLYELLDYESLHIVIGKQSSTNIYDLVSEFSNYEKLENILKEYYSDRVIDMEIDRTRYVNLYGTMGIVMAGGEFAFRIDLRSTIKYLSNVENKKIVELGAFDDSGNVYNVQYTIEKQNSGKWIVTDEKGYNEFFYSEQKIIKYYLDTFSINASSPLKDYPPEYIYDEDYDTAWAEGAEGDGTGEWVELKAEEEIEVNGFEILNGYGKSDDLYYKNNRVKKVKIEFSDGSYIEKTLEDSEYWQEIGLNNTVKTSTIKITILEVYSGSMYQDTCISEIRVYK